MKDTEKKYSQWTKYYLAQSDSYLFPYEYVIRIFLGNYPELSLDKNYKNKKCCDISCGDGRNVTLLSRIGFDVWATEISEEICSSNKKIFDQLYPEHSVKFCVSHNDDLKFEDNFFDYLLAWNSIYYLNDPNHNIKDIIKEHARILKRGGYLVCSIPTPNCYSLQNAKSIGEIGNFVLDPHINNWGNGLLKGTIIHQFVSFQCIEEAFGEYFTDFRKCIVSSTCFGQRLEHFIFICTKK